MIETVKTVVAQRRSFMDNESWCTGQNFVQKSTNWSPHHLSCKVHVIIPQVQN